MTSLYTLKLRCNTILSFYIVKYYIYYTSSHYIMKSLREYSGFKVKLNHNIITSKTAVHIIFAQVYGIVLWQQCFKTGYTEKAIFLTHSFVIL